MCSKTRARHLAGITALTLTGVSYGPATEGIDQDMAQRLAAAEARIAAVEAAQNERSSARRPKRCRRKTMKRDQRQSQEKTPPITDYLVRILHNVAIITTWMSKSLPRSPHTHQLMIEVFVAMVILINTRC